MVRVREFVVLVIAIALMGAFIFPIHGQVGYQFGQNKVHYKSFDWKVFRTPHFDVHYYPEEEKAAYDAARMAERGYAYLSEVLDHQVKKRIPLILYASMNDFQQTNVVQGLLDQGTRGVTEGLKHRVVLPITGSYREFQHVLVHEMVHAFQFDLLANYNNTESRFNPPLWFVEGMAEYLSIGMDNTTRMWLRDGLRHDKLLSIEELNNTYDIRVYRLGESLWHFIGETYGKDMIGKIFKTALKSGSLEYAIQQRTGKTIQQLSKEWHDFARILAVPSDSQLVGLGDQAMQLTRREGYFHRMNIVPSVSPDGKHIAYLANKFLKDEIYLLSETAPGQYQSRHVITGGESKRFETLRFFETTLSWSGDGRRLAFVSKSGENDAIYIVDPFAGKVMDKIMFDDLTGLQSPTFSPDGEELVFVGLSGGISDLYRYNLSTGRRTQLTNDRYAELHPQWSPDGRRIAFITDRGSGTDLNQLFFGDNDLAVYDLSSGQIHLLTDLPGNVINPQWSPDGASIVVVSDHQGIPNIYELHLESGQFTRITSLKSGVAGVTDITPAISWSADGRTLIFSAFDQNSWQLYKLKPEFLPAARLLSSTSLSERRVEKEADTDHRQAAVFPVKQPAAEQWLSPLPEPNDFYRGYALAEQHQIERKKYSRKFMLDAVVVGGGYDSFFGVSGGAQFLFSDMLGDQNIYFSSGLRFNSFLHSDMALTYFDQGHRFNYGLQGFQFNQTYTLYGSFNSTGYLRNTYRGFNVMGAYPFSRFSRVELSAGLTWVDQDLLIDTYRIGGVDRETVNQATFNYAQLGGAFVFDNTVYGLLGPAGGMRSRFSVETAMNDFQFTNFVGDYRRYFRVSGRTFLAWRLLGAASVGRDEQVFAIGGPYTYRGADYEELFGTRFFVSNLEYRFPLLPFLKPGYDVVSLAAFWDAAAAWGIDTPGISNRTFQPFSSRGGFHLQDLNSALGMAIRFSMGYLLLQYEIAWPTDLQRFDKPVKKFSIGTFF